LVVPSLSENFGIVVAEGLSYSLPVITTVGTPWSALTTERCGWWIALGTDPLVVALRNSTNLSPEELAEMGRRGRHFAEAEFGWPRIVDQMIAVYAWLTGNGTRPDSVQVV
jgi:glycosyltransferase involved in cell wall biosynthesis